MAPIMAEPSWVSASDLRTAFTLAMSAMYKSEVPLYSSLVHIVNTINTATQNSAFTRAIDPTVLSMRTGNVTPSRLDIERHGAIRLGTAAELRTIRRVFALIGLEPVGYYDLAAAGLPMHATCFRPTSAEALCANPFRVFTSVLRPELLKNAAARDLALELLSKRNLFSGELLALIEQGETQGHRFTSEQGTKFVAEAMKTFSWHGTAASSYSEYKTLQAEHPILADIACFRSAHINHLTPRTLDIVAAQESMKANNLCVKDRIEGPPLRKYPILLRQTSFLAIEEPIGFLTGGKAEGEVDGEVSGSHRARFGEIEERGAAVTAAGRKLYDDLLSEAMTRSQENDENVTAERLDELVAKVFERYPDDWEVLREQGLVYYTIECTSKGLEAKLDRESYSLKSLLDQGVLEALPITYEDFLPLSAAGIFQSNLGSGPSQGVEAAPDVKGMEEALGTKPHDSDALYRKIEVESISQCAARLGIHIQG